MHKYFAHASLLKARIPPETALVVHIRIHATGMHIASQLYCMKSLKLIMTYCMALSLLENAASAENMTILVHSFQNTGDPAYSWLSAGMTASVISDLGTIQGVTVISEVNRKIAMKEIEFSLSGAAAGDKILKTGKMLGADVIFTGSYLVVGSHIRVHANIVNVEKASLERSVKIDGTLDTIFELQDRIVSALMSEIEKMQIAEIRQVTVTDKEKSMMGRVEKQSLNAYELYAKGLENTETNPREALEYFRQAITIQPDHIDALREAGITAGITLSLFEEAHGYLTNAENILKGKGELITGRHADIMKNIGTVLVKKGALNKGLESYAHAKDICCELGLQNTILYASIIMNIGNVHCLRFEPDKALELYLTARSIYIGLGLEDSILYAYILNNIGIAYKNEGALDRALACYSNAKMIYDRHDLQNTDGYAFILNNIGISYRKKGEHDKALAVYMRSKMIKERLELQNTVGYASILKNIELAYRDKGEYEKALDFYLISKGTMDRLEPEGIDGHASVFK